MEGSQIGGSRRFAGVSPPSPSNGRELDQVLVGTQQMMAQAMALRDSLIETRSRVLGIHDDQAAKQAVGGVNVTQPVRSSLQQLRYDLECINGILNDAAAAAQHLSTL